MTIDKKEMLRLGSIAEQFNTAVAAYIRTEPMAGPQLEDVLDQNPDMEEKLAEIAMELIEAVVAAAEFDNNDEDMNSIAALHSIAFLDMFIAILEKAGLEDDVALYMPMNEKTQKNADSFNAIHAHNVARLCLK